MERSEAKRRAQAAIEAQADRLIGLSHAIHGFAEIAFTEQRSAAACVELLRENDIPAELGAYDLATAFSAEFGTGVSTGPVVGCSSSTRRTP